MTEPLHVRITTLLAERIKRGRAAAARDHRPRGCTPDRAEALDWLRAFGVDDPSPQLVLAEMVYEHADRADRIAGANAEALGLASSVLGLLHEAAVRTLALRDRLLAEAGVCRPSSQHDGDNQAGSLGGGL